MAAQALPTSRAYEQHIFETGTIPTREGLHDFFNGLAWSLFPRSKQRLNAMQAAEIARRGIGATRGPLRDRITVLDESGALVFAPAPLWDALVTKDWQRAFGELRPRWREAQVWILGHALLEQLARPRKNLTAHVWRLEQACSHCTGVDAQLAQALLHAGTLAPAPAHLPLLGVPGWHAANADPAFYEDTTVFRPPGTTAQRTARATSTPPLQ